MSNIPALAISACACAMPGWEGAEVPIEVIEPLVMTDGGTPIKTPARNSLPRTRKLSTAAAELEKPAHARFLDMLGVFAEFETNLRRERQVEGIAKAKAAGVYRGRKPSVDAVEVKRLKAEGLGASQIAKRLKIGRASVYRVLEA